MDQIVIDRRALFCRAVLSLSTSSFSLSLLPSHFFDVNGHVLESGECFQKGIVAFVEAFYACYFKFLSLLWLLSLKH